MCAIATKADHSPVICMGSNRRPAGARHRRHAQYRHTAPRKHQPLQGHRSPSMIGASRAHAARCQLEDQPLPASNSLLCAARWLTSGAAGRLAALSILLGAMAMPAPAAAEAAAPEAASPRVEAELNRADDRRIQERLTATYDALPSLAAVEPKVIAGVVVLRGYRAELGGREPSRASCRAGEGRRRRRWCTSSATGPWCYAVRAGWTPARPTSARYAARPSSW